MSDFKKHNLHKILLGSKKKKNIFVVAACLGHFQFWKQNGYKICISMDIDSLILYVSVGVPQGLVLGPLFRVLTMNIYR